MFSRTYQVSPPTRTSIQTGTHAALACAAPYGRCLAHVACNMHMACMAMHLDRSARRQKQKRAFSSISHAHALVERHYTCTSTHVARAQTHMHTHKRWALGDHLIFATPTEGVHGNGDGHRLRVLRDDDKVLVRRVVLDLKLHQDGLLGVLDFIASKQHLIRG